MATDAFGFPVPEEEDEVGQEMAQGQTDPAQATPTAGVQSAAAQPQQTQPQTTTPSAAQPQAQQAVGGDTIMPAAPATQVPPPPPAPSPDPVFGTGSAKNIKSLKDAASSWMAAPSRYDIGVVQQGMESIRNRMNEVRRQGMMGVEGDLARRGLSGSTMGQETAQIARQRFSEQEQEQLFNLMREQALTAGQDRAAAFGAGRDAVGMGEQARQFGASLGLRRDQLAADTRLRERSLDLQERGLDRDESWRMAQLEEQRRQFDIGQEFARDQFGFEQERFGTEFGEQQRQFDELRAMDQARMDLSDAQFQQQFGLSKQQFEESKNQFAQQFGLSEAEFREGTRRFEAAQELERDRFGFERGRFEQEFGEQQRQFDAIQEMDRARMAMSDRQFEAQFGLSKEQFEASRDQWERQFGYGQERDRIADERYGQQWDEDRRRYEEDKLLRALEFLGGMENATPAQVQALLRQAGIDPGARNTPQDFNDWRFSGGAGPDTPGGRGGEEDPLYYQGRPVGAEDPFGFETPVLRG